MVKQKKKNYKHISYLFHRRRLLRSRGPRRCAHSRHLALPHACVPLRICAVGCRLSVRLAFTLRPQPDTMWSRGSRDDSEQLASSSTPRSTGNQCQYRPPKRPLRGQGLQPSHLSVGLAVLAHCIAPPQREARYDPFTGSAKGIFTPSRRNLSQTGLSSGNTNNRK